MENIRHIRKTELARNTRKVINSVLRGQTAVIESHGEPEVAIMDILDYRITRAIIRYYLQRPEIDVDAVFSQLDEIAEPDPQSLINQVMAHYLAGSISLARAAEILDRTWLDLRTRFLRLEVPIRTAPSNLTEAKRDVQEAERWTTQEQ